MEKYIIFAAIGPAVLGLLVWTSRRITRIQTLKAIVAGFLVLNGMGVLAVTAVLLTGTPIMAQEQGPAGHGADADRSAQTSRQGEESKNMAAALAVGISTIAAGIAVAVTGSAAIGGMTQNPDIFGRSLVFVGLAEGIAIYGLIISFMILMGFGGGGGG